MIFQYIDGIKFKMGAEFDFSFLKKYGTVFKVFDDQDSGNICFGINSLEGKIFVNKCIYLGPNGIFSLYGQ